MIKEDAIIEVCNDIENNMVGRFFTYSFYDFSIDKIEILNQILLKETKCDKYSIDYPSAIICCNPIHLIDLVKTVDTIVFHDELERAISIQYRINWNRKEIAGIVFIQKNIIDKKHTVQDTIKIARFLSSYIKSLINNISDSSITSNYFIQKIALWDADFSGTYDFGKMRVDFGLSQPERKDYKVVLCEMQYNQYQLKEGYYPTFDFIERRSTTLLTLLQLFLRTPFYVLDSKTQICSNQKPGVTVEVSRTDYANEYITDKINNNIIPADVKELFNCYESLSADYQDKFISASLMYVKGLKQRNNLLLSITSFVIAIETLSNIYPNISKTKVGRIIGFINRILKKPISEEYIDKCYKIRSLNVHDGQSNEGLINNIFLKYIGNNDFGDYLERIANFTLIGWLKNGFIWN